MGIDIEAFRVSIANTDVLNHIILKRKYLRIKNIHISTEKRKARRQIIICGLLLLMTILTMMSIQMLLLIGCIELNPGPFRQNQLHRNKQDIVPQQVKYGLMFIKFI